MQHKEDKFRLYEGDSVRADAETAMPKKNAGLLTLAQYGAIGASNPHHQRPVHVLGAGAKPLCGFSGAETATISSGYLNSVTCGECHARGAAAARS